MKNAVLLATLESLHTPHHLANAIVTAATTTRNRLTIVLFARFFNTNSDHGLSHTAVWDDVQRLLTFVYVQATKVAQDKDNILLHIDVLLKGFDQAIPDEILQDVDAVYHVSGGDGLPTIQLPPSTAQITIDPEPNSAPSTSPNPPINDDKNTNEPSTYPVVALGGTFDHLHAGHKILLSMAAWIANTKIIVGVTDTSLLTSKAYHAYLEPLSTRITNVRHFLSLFRPGLEYDIVPINDVYGPTGWDPNVQALVVSQETLKGADAIATHRASKSLPPLRTFVIDVISHDSEKLDHQDVEMLKQTKMGSTFIREWIAKRDAQKTS
ncbi:Nucleotidylyl transferase [Dendrothele bispora CBS 962.96]|uniref:Nucleotidylyl transferase n=1 Tax=Dendrothele bispora (strain CBS 962.96) TaxID=1314807 RepID=A0A4S8KYX0_DENBC|nr:Nucleotidylyl transferase [Dendrothele bispora CBS 962.96]